ncbi:MAG: cyclodeaminase/cyclohydrolase family protein, partial [Candidatus Omnitrophica bacterium]|nr:cyclodeaminase/cyclohydrolase family protein [Candidatus Omnitrophota bacterium]
MYVNKSLKKYIDELAAKKPVPGGGSAAGLAGAIGTALLEMVCNFTIGNDKYKSVEKTVKKHLFSLTKARKTFLALIDDDTEIYSKIRDAFRTKDKKIIEKALKDGYYVSSRACRLSKGTMETALGLAEKGNPNLITDVGCAAELLQAAFNSAAFNCKIN